MTSGGVVSLTDPIHQSQYSAEEVRAVVDEALRRETYVCAHAYSPEAIDHSISNGVTCIEHGNLLDRPTARKMAELKVALDPTLATYVAMDKHGTSLGMDPIARDKNSKVLDAGKVAVELAVEEGLAVGFGTDLMGDLEELQLSGLAIQHEVQGTLGLLRSVTSVNSDILGVSDVGRLGVGCAGDLLVFSRNPFDKPQVLWNEHERPLVISHGRVIQ
jgi:imidazolonepropionase-like amidohydrolase